MPRNQTQFPVNLPTDPGGQVGPGLWAYLDQSAPQPGTQNWYTDPTGMLPPPANNNTTGPPIQYGDPLYFPPPEQNPSITVTGASPNVHDPFAGATVTATGGGSDPFGGSQTAGGYNYYDAGNGTTYVYDANWNYISTIQAPPATQTQQGGQGQGQITGGGQQVYQGGMVPPGGGYFGSGYGQGATFGAGSTRVVAGAGGGSAPGAVWSSEGGGKLSFGGGALSPSLTGDPTEQVIPGDLGSGGPIFWGVNQSTKGLPSGNTGGRGGGVLGRIPQGSGGYSYRNMGTAPKGR